MERAVVDGVALAYEIVGQGEPVMFIHGGFVADALRPLLAEPTLAGRYRLLRYHRRGYGEVHRWLLAHLPRSEGVVVPDAMHLLPLERPRATAEAIATFVARHPIDH